MAREAADIWVGTAGKLACHIWPLEVESHLDPRSFSSGYQVKGGHISRLQLSHVTADGEYLSFAFSSAQLEASDRKITVAHTIAQAVIKPFPVVAATGGLR